MFHVKHLIRNWWYERKVRRLITFEQDIQSYWRSAYSHFSPDFAHIFNDELYEVMRNVDVVEGMLRKSDAQG